MKKQFTFFLYCTAFVLSGMAQYSMPKFYQNLEREMAFDKIGHDGVLEQFLREFNFEKENMFLSTKQNPYPKVTDWYEPDTITMIRNIYENNGRLVCRYNNGNLTERLYQNWENNQWISYRKYNYKYGTQNNMTEQLYQEKQSGVWVDLSITTYSYDIQKNLIEELTQLFQAPVEKTRWTYTYDERNNVTNRLFQISFSNNQWDRIYEYNYTYDVNNNLIICDYFGFTEDLIGGDLCGWKVTYAYDEQNNLIESLSQTLYCENWQYVDDGITNYIYDEQNNLIEKINHYPWMGVWKKNRNIYKYDISNNKIEDLWQQWESNQWQNFKKNIYSYDTNNNLQVDLLQAWESNQWKNICKTNYTYDEKNNGNTVFYQHWGNNTWVDEEFNLGFYYNNMLSNYGYALLGMPCHRLEISCTKVGNVSIQENPSLESTLILYPNPVSNILYIETCNTSIFPKVKIYSIEGILLINTKGNRIDISSLSTGVYIAEIDGICRKFVKQ